MVGLERLELDIQLGGLTAVSSVVVAEGKGLRLDHRWQLDEAWRTQSVSIERWNSDGHAVLRLDRQGDIWRVNGEPRADLEGADEADLSVTPFCNSFGVRKTPSWPGASLALDIAYIDGATLEVSRSRQRYDRKGYDRLRYVDLGLALGFEAELLVDQEGLVLHYEGLFELVEPDAERR